MKKFSLLLSLCLTALMVPQRVWAAATITPSSDGKTLTISQVEVDAGTLSSNAQLTAFTSRSTVETIILDGYFTSSDLEAIDSGDGFTAVKKVDMSEARFVKSAATSNAYQLFTNQSEADDYSGTKGPQAIIGGTLYQRQKAKVWVEKTSLNELPLEYSSVPSSSSLPATSGYALGDYYKVTSGYKYLQMSISSSSWTVPASTPSSYTDVSWTDCEKDSHKDEFSNGQSVRYKKYYLKEVISNSRHWVQVTSEEPTSAINGNHYGTDHVDADLNMSVSEYGLLLDRCTNGEYMKFYVYYEKINGSWTFSAEKTNATTSRSYDYDAGFVSKDTWESQNSGVDNGKVVRYTWYFQKQESYSWNGPVCPTSEVLNNPSTIFYDGAGVGADETDLKGYIGAVGAYIWFYHYLTKSDTRQWNELSSDEGCADATFEYAYRNNHMAGYADGAKVKVSYNQYYKLEESNSDGEWVIVPSYIEGSRYPLASIVADEPSLPNYGNIGDYAVVGGTKESFKNGSWVAYDTSLSVPDYSSMTFKGWQGTIKEAITSKYADASITGDIFQGCNSLKKVDYLSGVVKGLNDRNRSESTHLEVFIGKDVTEIAPAAFNQNRALEKITFDTDYSELTSTELANYPKPLIIGNNAFNDCNYLEGVEIPNRTISIGNNAFAKAGNAGIDINNANDEANKSKKFTVTFERRVSADGRVGGIDCNFPLTIGESAFQDCYFIRHLSLPIRLESMGDNAFKNTVTLEDLEMREVSNSPYVPETGHHLLETIPSGAFSGSHVKKIVIPSTVTLIEGNAFGETNYLAEVTFQIQKDQSGNALSEQKPLVIKSGAFANGNEQIVPPLDVYVNVSPSDRMIICEYNAFNFTQMEGQTDENNQRRGILHFKEEDWDYYQGDWKRGLTFSQSNLNAFKDGYNGTYTKDVNGTDTEITLVGMADESVRSSDPNFASNSTYGKYTSGLSSDQEYAPANGWQMFVGTSTGVDVVIKSGTFLRTYSTKKTFDIPKAVIGYSSEESNLVDVYRVTAFTDGYNDVTDVGYENDRNRANAAERKATAVALEYIPKNTGLIMKGNVPEGSGYVTYFKEKEFGSGETEILYPWSDTPGNNFLMPTCVDDDNIVEQKSNGESVVILNPTQPYPISGSNPCRIFGFRSAYCEFYRSIPDVEMARDRAYLKLPTGVFHWSNEEWEDGKHGQEVSGLDDSPSGSRITLVFGFDDAGELTDIKLPEKVSEAEADDSFYTIQGVKLSHPLGRGLYIYKGKKIFVK